MKGLSWSCVEQGLHPAGLGLTSSYSLFTTQMKTEGKGVPVMAQQLTNPTNIHEHVGSTPRLTQWLKDLVLL